LKDGCGCYHNVLDSLQLLCNNSTRLDGRLHIEIVSDGFDAMNKHYLIVSFKLLNYKELLSRELYRNVVVDCAAVPTTSDIEVVRSALFAFFTHLHDISKRRVHVFWSVSSTPGALPLPNTAAAEATKVIFRCDDDSDAEVESEDEEVPIEFWLGGDLEMQRIFMGVEPKKVQASLSILRGSAENAGCDNNSKTADDHRPTVRSNRQDKQCNSRMD